MECLAYTAKQLNHNFRKYYIIDTHGRLKSLWTSPVTLAYGVDYRLNNSELFGDRLKALSLEDRKNWKAEVTRGLERYNISRMEISRVKDELYKKRQKIQIGDYVTLKNYSRYPKFDAAKQGNIFQVMDRKYKMLVVKPLYGPDAIKTEEPVYTGDARLFTNQLLLRHLPKNLQEGLGAGIPLEPSNLFPWQISATPEDLAARKRQLDKLVKQVQRAGQAGRLKGAKGKKRNREIRDSDSDTSIATLSIYPQTMRGSAGSSGRSDVLPEGAARHEEGRGHAVPKRGDVVKPGHQREPLLSCERGIEDSKQNTGSGNRRRGFFKRMMRQFRKN